MGEIAAILTSVCWTFSAVIFTFAGKQVGAVILNRIRLIITLLLCCLAHLIIQGSLVPLDAGIQRWFWLGLSGLIGLTLGDLALYQAYLSIGPRLGTLIMASVPVLSAFLAWLFLGEILSLGVNIGIAVAVSGIALVILERGSRSNTSPARRPDYLSGLMFGFLAAIGQTVGLILTKHGLAGDYPAISGVLIRMLVAALFMWLPAIFQRQVITTFSTLRDRRILALMLVGSVIGPFAGIWLSTIAVQKASVGIASTLMSLNPIFLLPLSSLFFHEKITLRAVFGTLITVVGVGLIFLL